MIFFRLGIGSCQRKGHAAYSTPQETAPTSRKPAPAWSTAGRFHLILFCRAVMSSVATSQMTTIGTVKRILNFVPNPNAPPAAATNHQRNFWVVSAFHTPNKSRAKKAANGGSFTLKCDSATKSGKSPAASEAENPA